MLCGLQVAAGAAVSLHELKVSSKLGEQRRRQQRQAATAAARGTNRGALGAVHGGVAEEIDVSEAELHGVPVLWVQVCGTGVCYCVFRCYGLMNQSYMLSCSIRVNCLE